MVALGILYRLVERAVVWDGSAPSHPVIGFLESFWKPGGSGFGRRYRPGIASGEGQALHDARHVDMGDGGDLAEVALAFAVLAFCEVTAALFAAQDLTGTGDLEPFGDALPRFASGDFLSHRRGGDLQRSTPRQPLFR